MGKINLFLHFFQKMSSPFPGHVVLSSALWEVFKVLLSPLGGLTAAEPWEWRALLQQQMLMQIQTAPAKVKCNGFNIYYLHAFARKHDPNMTLNLTWPASDIGLQLFPNFPNKPLLILAFCLCKVRSFNVQLLDIISAFSNKPQFYILT